MGRKKLYNNNKWLDIINQPKYEEYRKKISETFKDLVFDEEPHKYYLGDRELTCVSDITHMFKEHFDSVEKAQETYERNYNRPDSKYYRMTPEEILASWKKISEDACDLGSQRHNFGESVFYFMVGRYDDMVPEFKDRLHQDDNGDWYVEAKYPKEEAILEFWNDIPRCMVPILAENKVYIVKDEYAYSGTFDILFYFDAELNGGTAENSGLVVFDYKTNRDLYKNFKEQRLLAPFEGLLDCPLSLYKLQLSAYQNCLENIGLKVLGRRLIWVLPDGTYKKIPLECYTEKLDRALKDKMS